MSERCKEFWRRRRLTRRGRLIRNLVCIVLLASMCWCFKGYPVLTPMQAFRRAERQNLVQPAETVRSIEADWAGDRRYSYRRVILAEYAGGYALSAVYAYGLPVDYNCSYWYREKEGPATLLTESWSWFSDSTAMVVFTELPAARGELAIGSEEAVTCQGERLDEGVFLFLVDHDAAGDESDSMGTLINVIQGWEIPQTCRPTPVTIRLWDEAGTLIHEETRIYGSKEEST